MNLSNIKFSYICRNIEVSALDTTCITTYVPQAGDMACFEVIHIGKHQKIQDHNGINRTLMLGDRLMLAFGARYASAQFEGYVPEHPLETYDLLGQGGVVGELASAHAQFRQVGPTLLRMVGYAVDAWGHKLNTHYRANTRPLDHSLLRPRTILSVGTSMDSGKTTTAAYLAHGFQKAGHKVAFIKLTGTCYMKDAQLSEDLGAAVALDFSHFGFPSTYLYDVEVLTELYHHLRQAVQVVVPDIIIIEIADGLLQRETAALLQHPPFMRQIDHIVFSSGDSMGLLGGLQVLDSYGLRPTALSGLITASPLLVEEARAFTNLPFLDLVSCADPLVLETVFALAEAAAGSSRAA